jgi:catechol 2,3-dioxygenase-like lactoylglutathione lyase family enzyme
MSRPALVPELYVSDLRVSLEFYQAVLGFQVEYERPEDRFVALSLGGAQLMLEEAPSLARATPAEFAQGQWRPADLEPPFGRGVNFEIRVDDIDAANERIATRGYPLLLDVHQKGYRLQTENRIVRQLLVADPDGYLIRLSEFD